MRTWIKIRIEEIIVSNSSLVWACESPARERCKATLFSWRSNVVPPFNLTQDCLARAIPLSLFLCSSYGVFRPRESFKDIRGYPNRGWRGNSGRSLLYCTQAAYRLRIASLRRMLFCSRRLRSPLGFVCACSHCDHLPGRT